LNALLQLQLLFEQSRFADGGIAVVTRPQGDNGFHAFGLRQFERQVLIAQKAEQPMMPAAWTGGDLGGADVTGGR
jgi:hypothetical protein